MNAVSVNDSTHANIVTFGRKRSPRMQYPVDSIGADTIKKGYIDYPIKRYYDYRQVDTSYGGLRPFIYAEIHAPMSAQVQSEDIFHPCLAP